MPHTHSGETDKTDTTREEGRHTGRPAPQAKKMTSNFFIIFFLITVLRILCLTRTSFAFVLPVSLDVALSTTTTTTTTTTSRLPSSSSVTALFAKKKKKTTTNNTRSKPSGGGTGFGNTDANKSPSATSTAASRTTAKNQPLDEPNKEELSQVWRMNSPLPPPPIKAVATATARRKKWSERIELSDETDLLMATYMEEFRQQELREKEEGITTSTSRKLVRISKNPLIFTIDEFLDPVECSKVNSKGSGCFDLYYPENVSDRLFNKQESEMDSLLFRDSSSTEHNEKMNDGPYYPDGVHMDTTNSCMFRHVTTILYLNDIPKECGGGTVFPVARALPNDPALLASRRLLSEKISHTRSKAAAEVKQLAADAKLLESRIGTNFEKDPHTETAIRIQPKAGRLLIFFSRDCNGKEDPRAWHAGERIKDNPLDKSVTEKRILNLFKQVDYNNDDDPNRAQPSRAQTTLEEYLAPQIQEQQQWLQAIAQLSS